VSAARVADVVAGQPGDCVERGVLMASDYRPLTYDSERVGCGYAPLVPRVDSQAQHRRRPARAVVPGILNPLQVRVDLEHATKLEPIVRLEDAFRRVGERSIAQQEANTASREVRAVHGDDAVLHDGDGYAVVRARPVRATHLKAGAEMTVHFREGERLVGTIVPAATHKAPGLTTVGEWLFDVDPKTRLGPTRRIVRDDVGHGTRGLSDRERARVAPHASVVDEAEQSDGRPM